MRAALKIFAASPSLAITTRFFRQPRMRSQGNIRSRLILLLRSMIDFALKRIG